MSVLCKTNPYVAQVARLLLVLVGMFGLAACRVEQQSTGQPQLRFTGELRHNWLGHVEGKCRLLVQPFDVALNGSMLGTAYESEPQQLAAGALRFDVPASALPNAQAPVWLRLGVRCNDDAPVWMAPRLEHRGTTTSAPAAQSFLCVMPNGVTASTQPPMIEGGDYIVRGGFTFQR